MEKIVENLKRMPKSAQAEVLAFVEYLKSNEDQGCGIYTWEDIFPDPAMRGIAKEPGPYELGDIKEKF